MTVIGPTESGKTWLVAELLERWQWVVMIATKKKDDSYRQYKGYTHQKVWHPDWYHQKIFLDARPRHIEDFEGQREIVYACLSDIFERGGYTVSFDDIFYLSERLRLRKALQLLYTYIRSNKVTLVANEQRVQNNPLETVSQATHLFIFRIYDIIDIERVASATSIDRKRLLAAISTLDSKQHQCLYLRQGSQEIVRLI